MDKIKIGVLLTSCFLVLGSIASFSAFEAHVVNVTARIENALNVTPESGFEFGTVFPQEHLERSLSIKLSRSFLEEDRVDSVDYVIKQKSKPRPGAPDLNGSEYETTEEYCHNETPADSENYYDYCYPSLCEYLSKNPDIAEGNDGQLDAFHDPGAVVEGYLSKSEEDVEDNWVIDLQVPCFEGQCAQEWSHRGFELDRGLEGEELGCDLWIEVGGINEEPESFRETKAIDLERDNAQRAEIEGGNEITDMEGDFTVEFWMKKESTTYGAVTGNPGSETAGYTWFIRDRADTGKLDANIRGTDGNHHTVTSDGPLSPGIWYHIALTWDNTAQKQRLYVDGVQQADTDGGFSVKWNALDWFVVGAARVIRGPYQHFDGMVDELRISDTVRYTSDFAPPTTEFSDDAHTLGLYHFNGNAEDSSSNGLDLIEINSPFYK